MIPIIDWQQLSKEQQKLILQRPTQNTIDEIREKTQSILNNVRDYGDGAIKEYTMAYDNVALDCLKVTPDEITAADGLVSYEVKAALQQAKMMLEKFHKEQIPTPVMLRPKPGIILEKQSRPIARIGLYVPGGLAPLVSTVLMLGIPAKIAGCQNKVLCTPPLSDGSIHPAILYAAKLCEIDNIFKVGGAQAIAGMAFGTQTMPKVDKIFGPGNVWVTMAKLLCAQDPNGAAYDLPAGPSEVMIIADNTANSAFIAADLIAQAEHSADAQVMLVCDCEQLALQVQAAVIQQLSSLPRETIARQALVNGSIILVPNIATAVTIANRYAPEHLLIQTAEPRLLLSNIQAAGSVFLGAYSPESVGDYASGTNHILPTSGYARSYSGLSVSDFMKQLTVQELDVTGLEFLRASVTNLAEIEGLIGHKRAVSIRFGELT